MTSSDTSGSVLDLNARLDANRKAARPIVVPAPPRGAHSPAVTRKIERDAHEQELQIAAARKRAERETPPTATPVTVELLTELLASLVEGSPFEGPISTDGRSILVDVADPTAPDGLGRTFYLRLEESPR